MDRLITQQHIYYEQLKASIKTYEADLGKRKPKKYYSRRLRTTEEWWAEFDRRHNQILELLVDTPSASKNDYFANELYSEVEECYLSFAADLSTQLHDDSVVDKSFTDSSSDHSAIKLPRINLPKFEGDYVSWTSFCDLFVALIHSKSNISKAEKLHYLKASVSGEAERLIQGFAISEANYETAWDVLVNRYDNKRMIINSHLDVLFNRDACTESSGAIKGLLDVTSESVQALMNLEVENLWETILIYLTVKKFPKDTLQLWEQQIADASSLPTFKTLKKFLEARFRTLEAIESTKSKSANTSKNLTPVRRQVLFTKHKPSCGICGGEHVAKYCQDFIRLSFAERNDTVKRLGLCINCLNRGHLASSCPSKFSCNNCGKRHHTLMHIFSPSTKTQLVPTAREFEPSTSSATIAAQTNQSTVQALHAHVQREVLLATALVTLEGPFGDKQTFRALLDQGSQATFITENVAQTLKLRKQPANAIISGVGSTGSDTSRAKSAVRLIPRMNEESFIIEAFVLKSIANNLPTRSVAINDWRYLDGLNLADPSFNHPGRVDVLLGADIYATLIRDGTKRGSPKHPVAINTALGWVLCGEVPNAQRSEERLFAANVLVDDISTQLQRFWELEETPSEPILKPEDEVCEQHFVQTHQRLPNGKYLVKLPFASSDLKDSLGTSLTSALSSLLHLERKFSNNSELRREYSECIQEYVNLGHMTPASNSAVSHDLGNTPCFYLPHHAVFKDSSTTHLRVVFDASRKSSSGYSLNDVLLTGPAIQNELIRVLLQWRRHKFCFMADIEKMYRQIQVHPDDIDFQRILWRSSPDDRVQHFCLTTVTFGVTCAPFLAIRVLKQLASDEKSHFPVGSQAILDDFYVDDLLSGENTVETALSKQRELNSILKSAGFKLRKWLANDRELLKDIPHEDCAASNIVDLSLDSGFKSLGLLWYPSQNTFGYKVGLDPIYIPISKRQLLSEIAKLYDPLGWISPIVICAKLLMQELWLLGTDWDDSLPDKIANLWREFKDNLRYIAQIRIPRWLNTLSLEQEVEIHAFSDASEQAYAAAIYIRCLKSGETFNTQLLISKARVKPAKLTSIPRLELCGAVLAAKLLKFTQNVFKNLVSTAYLWTDSMIVLSWLSAHPSKWKTFIGNRTSKILEILGSSPRYYVSTSENPADLASRGVTANELINCELWWHGPTWLREKKATWPTQPTVPSATLDAKQKVIEVKLCTKDAYPLKMLHRFSSLTKLLAVTALCVRIAQRARRSSFFTGYVRPSEFKYALTIWIRIIQSEEFKEEMRNLQNKRPLNRRSSILRLHPFVDKEGLLRVGGRIKNAELDYDERFPIIIPKSSHIVELLLRYYHALSLHGGPQLMSTIIRKRYWIINGRNLIRHFTQRCITCFRQKSQTSSQLMGDLPSYRVTQCRPFTNTGVDYCGPLQLKMSNHRNAKSYKGYIAIFVCLAVKAVHIELVSDMTTSAFIAAFRRFVARRGLCKNLFSDCGTNFVGANAMFKEIRAANQAAAKEFASEEINWHFIPPSAPHFGGLWESCVKRAKFHLKRILGDTTLTFEELCTVLTQVEACMNSAPLCPLTTDPDDTAILTPGHFLIGDALLAPPQIDYSEHPTNRLERWQFTQKLTQHFWNRWSHEYLQQLQQRQKWTTHQKDLATGNTVLVKDERLPPNKWTLGRVLETHPGSDGRVRVVTIKTKNTVVRRPIAKLALLPIMDNETDETKPS